MTVLAMNLMELIRATKGERSYADLEEAAGGIPSAARWQQLATKEQKTFPDPGTLRRMARALGVAERVVVLATAQGLGLDAAERHERLVALLPPQASGLTDEQVDAVRHVIRVMAAPAEDQAERAAVAQKRSDLKATLAQTESGQATLR